MANRPDTGRAHIPTPRRTTRQRLGRAAARCASYITRVVPLRAGYMFCDRAGDLLYWRSRLYRLNVIENLRHVYGASLGELMLRRHGRHVFRTSARNFWDLTRVPHLGVVDFERIVRLPANDWSLFDRVREEGKGGIIMTAHLGAFDFVGQTLFVRGYNPYTLTSPTVGEFVYAAVNYLRHSQNAPLEDVSPAAIRRMLRVLLKGGFVGVVADRDFTDSGVPATFFGVETTLPVGPVRLARVSGAPILPVFAVREDDGGRDQRYAFHLFDPVFVERTTDEDADVHKGLQQMVAILERGIAMAPDQWVMFQRVWDDERPRRRALLDRLAAASAARQATVSVDAMPEPATDRSALTGDALPQAALPGEPRD
ncbi:MAG: hypothetical protein WEC79_07845 [Thermomicrobiales bacterium]